MLKCQQEKKTVALTTPAMLLFLHHQGNFISDIRVSIDLREETYRVNEEESSDSDQPERYSSSSSCDKRTILIIKRAITWLFQSAQSNNKTKFEEYFKILNQTDENLSSLVKPSSGMNILHYAARYGSDQIVELVMERGVRSDLPCAAVSSYCNTTVGLKSIFRICSI